MYREKRQWISAAAVFSSRQPSGWKRIGVDNGDMQNHDDLEANRRKAFYGLCMALVQSTTANPGEIRLTATSPGLKNRPADHYCDINCTKFLRSNRMMEISEAISQRKSIRAFKQDPIPMDTLKKILEESLRAPSWANTQPWEFAVVTGSPLNEIRSRFLDKAMTGPSPDIPRPPEFPKRYADRIRVLDKQNRLVTQKDWDSRRVQNFNHYGAPAVIYLLTERDFYYQTKGLNVWALYDCGSVVENILLLATKYELGTIVQAQAVVYPEALREVLGIPESKIIILGIAIGYPDWRNPINQFSTEREPLETITTWHGF